MRSVLALGSHVPSIAESVFVAPGALILGRVTLGSDSSVWYHAVLRGDVVAIRIGARVNIQEHAMVHGNSGGPDVVVGDDVTIGHRAIVHGATLGERVLIGMGAIVLDGALLEDECLVGAGALVTGGFHAPAGSLVLGSPARVARPLREEERAALRMSALHYVDNARLHRSAWESAT